MATVTKVCNECGMGITFGAATCGSCGAQIGTVFSEESFTPLGKPAPKRRGINPDAAKYEKEEKAKDRANSALVMSLASFFLPFIGAMLAVAAVVSGSLSARYLFKNQIEELRGSAIAGTVIGVLGILAQICYAIYIMKLVNFNPME